MPTTEKIEAKVEAAAEKSRAKASRPWYKKKRYVIPLAIVAVVVMASANGGVDDTTTNAISNDQAASQAAVFEQRLYPNRPDYNKGDVEGALGQSGEVSDYEVTVTQGGHQPKLNVLMDKGYLVADVTIINKGDKAQSYNPFDWKLLTPNGQIIDPTFGADNDLHSGDLTTGGRVSGKLVWEVGAQKGAYYVIYDPPSFSPGRVIWKIEV